MVRETKGVRKRPMAPKREGAPKRAKQAPKKLRADAQRNRERILQVAKLAFTQNGAEISLDEVAKRSGVGPGTLYRHFPTREALLVAVYRTEVERLEAAQKEFSAALPPVEALRAWLLLFVDYIATKQLIAPALNTFIGSSAKLAEHSGAQIKGAIHCLVEPATRNGAIRPDLDPLDLLRALVGVAHVAPVPDWPDGARRLVHILIAGSRPEA